MRSRLTRAEVQRQLATLAASVAQIEPEQRATMPELDWSGWALMRVQLAGPPGETLDEALWFRQPVARACDAAVVARLPPEPARSVSHEPGLRGVSRMLHLAAAAGAARRGLILGGLRFAPTSLCPPVRGRRGQTRCVRCALSAQTVAASQSLMRALARPAPDGWPQPPRNIAPTGQRLPQRERMGVPPVARPNSCCQGVCAAGRSAPVRRREAQWPWPRAARSSTDSSPCLSGESAANAASLATGHGREHRREVGGAAPTASLKRCGLPAHALAPRGANKPKPHCAQKLARVLQTRLLSHAGVDVV